MNTQTKHTPGLLKFDRANDGLIAFRLAANGLIIADVLFKRTYESAPTEDEAKANATRLAHCWNHYDELLEACKFAMRELGPTSDGDKCWDAHKKLHTAIQKATGEA